MKSLTKQLDKNRQAVIPNLTARLEEILSNLGMTNARFEISIIPQENYNDYGNSKLEFIFQQIKVQILEPWIRVLLEENYPELC